MGKSEKEKGGRIKEVKEEMEAHGLAFFYQQASLLASPSVCVLLSLLPCEAMSLSLSYQLIRLLLSHDDNRLYCCVHKTPKLLSLPSPLHCSLAYSYETINKSVTAAHTLNKALTKHSHAGVEDCLSLQQIIALITDTFDWNKSYPLLTAVQCMIWKQLGSSQVCRVESLQTEDKRQSNS